MTEEIKEVEVQTISNELQKTFDNEALKEYTNKEVFEKAKEQLNIIVDSQESMEKALDARNEIKDFYEAKVAENKATIKELEEVKINKLKAENKLVENAGKAIVTKIDEEVVKFIQIPVEDTVDEATMMIIPGVAPVIDKEKYHLIKAKTPKGYNVEVTDEEKLYAFIKENTNERGVYVVEATGQEVQVMSLNTSALKAFAKATNGASLPGTTATSTVRTILKKGK